MLLSVVVPAYNEEDVLEAFFQRLIRAVDSLQCDKEIIFVNDGSTDSTLTILNRLKEHNPEVAIIDLSRNFGKEIAMTAGLDHTNGGAIVVIDADLQDPPELICEFFRYWQEGYDVIYAKRTARKGETFL